MNDDDFQHTLGNKLQARDSRDTLTVLSKLIYINGKITDIINEINAGTNIWSYSGEIINIVESLLSVLFYIGRVDGRYNLTSKEKDYQNVIGG